MNSTRPPAPLLHVLILSAVLTACSGLRHNTYAPVQVLRHEPLRCVITPGSDAVLPDSTQETAPTSAEGPILTLTLSLYGVDCDFAEELLGARMNGAAALVCSRDSAEMLRSEFGRLDGTRATVVSGPTTLRLHSGQPGSFALVHQSAYIRSCELQSTAEGATVDPEIGVVSEGLQVRTHVDHDPDSGSNAVALELWISRLERPFPSIELRTGRNWSPIQVQVPGGVLRHVTTSSVLAAEESLVFGGAALPVFTDGRALVAVLDAAIETDPAAAVAHGQD